MGAFYREYSEYLAEKFPGTKVQKISVNAGLGCPNRDGTIGRGGCIYCDNRSFTPSYCMEGDDVTVQLEKGKAFFAHKYPAMKYLAYFQSFTGTYARGLEELKALYGKAMEIPDVIGLVIGTRPDTLPDEVVALLADINKQLPVIVEIGVETSCDETLRLINRNHTWEDVENAITRLAESGIDVGVHLIAGLPGEHEDRILQSVRDVCRLPISSVKIHQLQVIRDTFLHHAVDCGKIQVVPYTQEQYLELCIKIIGEVPRHIAIERFLASAPPQMVVAPRWGIKNYEFVNKLKSVLQSRNNIKKSE